MSQSVWTKHHYELVTTEDGSPSLRSLCSSNLEVMHHSGGAWSETWYIYGQPMESFFAQYFKETPSSKKIQVASIGLGLGYNELLTSKIFSHYKGGADLSLVSFEKDPFLKEAFLNFIFDKKNESDNQTYNKILHFVAEGAVKETQIAERLLKEELKSLFEADQWKILGPLEDSLELLNESKFNVILYDAFSSKTSPELWSEEFLTQFLKMHAAEKCIFSTYACKGSLKRALKTNGFIFIERAGFKGKRNSSFAFRGISEI